MDMIATVGYALGGIAVLGGIVYFLGSQFRAGRKEQKKEISAEALATIATLQANVDAIEKQRDLIKEAGDKTTERLEKQIDDLNIRNGKLEDQVKNLSVIPWAKQEENHLALMNAIKTISDGQNRLIDFLESQQPITPTIPTTKTTTVVETK